MHCTYTNAIEPIHLGHSQRRIVSHFVKQTNNQSSSEYKANLLTFACKALLKNVVAVSVFFLVEREKTEKKEKNR